MTRTEKLEAHKNLEGYRLTRKLEHPADYMESTSGYLAGISDFRHNRTPEHSQSAYRFPYSGTVEEQEAYNTQYYEAQRDMERAREFNVAWYELHKEEL